MKRLLWKEYREKRIWMLLLVLSVVGLTAFRNPYTFLGLRNLADGLGAASALIALLYGLTAYSSEIGWGTPDFLFSRPISWKKVLSAKLIVAFSTMLFATLVGAAILRLWTPESHVSVLAAHWLNGVGLALLVMGVPYLIGLSVSVVFPGFLGSVIVLVGVLALVPLGMMMLQKMVGFRAISWNAVMWPVGALVAAIVVVRFGLTLKATARLRRYACALALGALAVLALNLPFPQRSWFVPGESAYLFSSDGSYLLNVRSALDLGDRSHGSYEATRWLIRVSDGLTHRLPWSERVCYAGWTPDGTVYGLDYTNQKRPLPIVTARINQAGKLIETRFVPGPVTNFDIRPSPDGRYAVMFRWGDLGNRQHYYFYRFVDISRQRLVDGVVRDPKYYWWQNSNTFAWVDKQGNRHFLKLDE